MRHDAAPIADIANPGIKAEGPLLHGLRQEVAGLLGRHQTGFPGAQPVSFARRHLRDLKSQDYYVCEKTDGIRYLLYLTHGDNDAEACYLIDRKNDFWWMHYENLHFPQPGRIEAHHNNTIVDGELVMDRDRETGKETPSFLVFDCLVMDGKSLMERSLEKRLGYFQQNIFVPYKELIRAFPEEVPLMAFQVVMKDMQFSYGIEKMFLNVLPNLKHGNDGLIFTCVSTPYKCGTDEHILKWKPVEENTVDFKLSLTFHEVEPDEQDRAEGVTEPYVDYEGVPTAKLLINCQGEGPGDQYREYAELYLEEEEWDTLKSLGDPLTGRIVECAMDEQGRWRMFRFRDDKHHGNHIKVVENVIESIRDPVTKEMLLEAAPTIKENWKLRGDERKAGVVALKK